MGGRENLTDPGQPGQAFGHTPTTDATQPAGSKERRVELAGRLSNPAFVDASRKLLDPWHT
jgi:hypothetical protein